jgi:2-desacetyl-2-hydroxyethyl bacteriochlorophyllide A dehydrogenase
MRAVVKRETGVAVVDKSIPEADESAGLVRVHVAASGICGSDLSLLQSGFPLRYTLGHEISGVTEDGRHVAVEPLVACGNCEFCLSGRHNLCVLTGARTVLGIGHDGGMAEQLVVPETCLHELPPTLAVKDACLAEPLAVAVHGLRLAGLKEGMRVAIIGAGTIGLCAAAAATEKAKVYVQARHAHQIAAAEAFGAQNLDKEEAFDLVVDAVGSAEALQQCVDLCRPGATLLLLASYDRIVLPGSATLMKELRLQTSMTYARDGEQGDFAAAIDILARRPEIADRLITHRVPLDQAERAFATAADRKQGAIKVVLEP